MEGSLEKGGSPVASAGTILFIAFGVACIFAGILIGKKRAGGKSTEERLAECFSDYNEQMEKFRK